MGFIKKILRRFGFRTESPMQARRIVARALRSGEYKQGSGCLEAVVRGEVLNCCLGVACREYIKAGYSLYVDESKNLTSFDHYKSELPAVVAKWLGFNTFNPTVAAQYKGVFASTLAGLNDSGVPFKEIAIIFEDKKGIER